MLMLAVMDKNIQQILWVVNGAKQQIKQLEMHMEAKKKRKLSFLLLAELVKGIYQGPQVSTSSSTMANYLMH